MAMTAPITIAIRHLPVKVPVRAGSLHTLIKSSKTAAGVEQITEITKLQRPRATAADGATNLNVTVIAKRQRGGKEV